MSFWAFFIILAAATAWMLYQLSRAPHNLSLRWLTWCLACASASYPLGTRSGSAVLDTVLVPGTAKVVQDILVLGMVFALMIFCLYSADGPAARRRVRQEALVFLGAVTGIVAAAVSAPHHAALSSTFEGADMAIPQVLAFYLGLGLYMLYALTEACRSTYRYALMSSGSEAAGLWVATAGLVGLMFSTAIRAVFTVVRHVGADIPGWLTDASAELLVASTPVFVLGVTWPGARACYSAWRLWLAHRRTYRQLEPLWRLLTSTYPDTVLLATGWGGGGTFAFARRVIEIRDGLIRLGPHLGEEWSAKALEPAALALHLRRVAEDVRQGRSQPCSGTPVAHGGSEAEEVASLVALSQAVRALPAGAA